jgi:type I restriction enzyme S subunit
MAVPKIRFPGFTDAWEQRKLDKIANRYDNLRIPVTASDRISGTTPYYGANGIQDYVKGFTHDGEFVLIAEDGANDLHNYPVQYVNGKVWVNNHAHVLQGINGLVDTRFLGYAFSQVNMEAILVGGSRAKLNASDLMKIEIRLPRLMQEQQHIATFLHSLDQTITLHQRKLESMKLLKKSLLQKMFPKSGETVPEVRFPGFTDAWEQHKCCDLLAMLKDGTHGTHKDADNGPYLLSAKNIKDGHIIIDETTDRKISISEFEQIHSKFKLQKGDVLLTIVGSIGESAILENPSNLTFQRSVAFLRPNSTVTSSFLRTTIESSGFQKELQDRKSQSAQPGVYLGELEKIPVSVPSLKEQEQIGSFFTELDDIITLHQRKVESLQKLKKSLLQQMFV